jgi:hypothetical protein
MNEELEIEMVRLRAANFVAGLHFQVAMSELIEQSEQIDSMCASVSRARHAISDWEEICNDAKAQSREINAALQEVGNRMEMLFGICA